MLSDRACLKDFIKDSIKSPKRWTCGHIKGYTMLDVGHPVWKKHFFFGRIECKVSKFYGPKETEADA